MLSHDMLIMPVLLVVCTKSHAAIVEEQDRLHRLDPAPLKGYIARMTGLDGLMPYLQQVEAHDAEVCDMAELGLWNGAKPSAQKAPAPGNSPLAAKGSIHVGADSCTKTGPTPCNPKVGHCCSLRCCSFCEDRLCQKQDACTWLVIISNLSAPAGSTRCFSPCAI